MTIQLGIYRHYKGPLYQVLGLAHDANAEDLLVRDSDTAHFCLHDSQKYFAADPLGERAVVVYIPLQLDGAHLGPRMAVRTLEDFEAWVCADESHDAYGRVMTNGSCSVRRFTYLGPELTASMLVEALKYKPVIT